MGFEIDISIPSIVKVILPIMPPLVRFMQVTMNCSMSASNRYFKRLQHNFYLADLSRALEPEALRLIAVPVAAILGEWIISLRKGIAGCCD